MRRALLALALVALAAGVAACGSSGSGSPTEMTVAPAKVYRLAAFAPAGPVVPGKPVTVSFHIVLPSGQTLTRFRTGAGPHTGIHLIIVRDDLAVIIHRHPRIQPDGTVRQTVVLPEPGKYHVLVDVYPVIPETPQLVNFQLTGSARARGTEKPITLPPPVQQVKVGGYTVRFVKAPKVTALTPALATIRITDAAGRAPTLEPWYGALAHAIFFRQGSLAYFHTHICAPSAPNCGSLAGSAAPTGHGTAKGVLHIGILLPQAGRWRLFLQFQVDHTVLTAPFTLQAH